MKQSKNLFDLTEEQIKILERIEEVAEETEGEIPAELWDTLIISKEELNDKVAAYVFRMEEFKAQQEALKAQMEIWEKKIEKKGRAIEFLKAGLGEVAKRLGTKNDKGNYSLQAGEIKVNYQFSHPVEIKDKGLIPNELATFDIKIVGLDKDTADTIKSLLVVKADDGCEDFKYNKGAMEIEKNVSKTLLKVAIETAADRKKTNEFTISETVPGAFVDNKKGFIKIY